MSDHLLCVVVPFTVPGLRTLPPTALSTASGRQHHTSHGRYRGDYSYAFNEAATRLYRLFDPPEMLSSDHSTCCPQVLA